jgi:trehalose-6-phosphate synthase
LSPWINGVFRYRLQALQIAGLIRAAGRSADGIARALSPQEVYTILRLSYRLNLALVAGVVLTSLGFALFQGAVEMHGLRNAVERNAALLAHTISGSVEPLAASGYPNDLQNFADRLPANESLLGIAVYTQSGQQIAITSDLARRAPTLPPRLLKDMADGLGGGAFTRLKGARVHVMLVRLRVQSQPDGFLAVFQDASNIDVQSKRVWEGALAHMAVQALCIVCITMLVLQMSLRRPVARMAQWLRDMHSGRPSVPPELSHEEVFEPITREVTRLASSLTTARAAAEEEARLREAGESLWTLERLRVHVQSRLDSSRLFVISNREPYEHIYSGGSIEWKVPPSGLVTALEPVLSACGGTWIAQGTGDADSETVDERGRVAVPPDDPKYSLRRIWLTPGQESGFYLGFSNEGMWPLCHIAHTRPSFRTEDWNAYREVNSLFCDAFLEESAGEEHPIVLVQDYHFALLPRMIKQRMPGARVALFWHIPWPNPEAFGICPWKQELLEGMLGADLIGFQIQAHCNNFLDTVDRFMESRLEREHYGVNRMGHFTSVRPFPISVAADPSPVAPVAGAPVSVRTPSSMLGALGVDAAYFGVGVDRIDYTKGIPERFRGIERFFELYPQYRKQFTFVQIGAPSRTHIRRYQELADEVEKEAARINRRFQSGAWKPIVMLKRQHSHAEILPYYRAAAFCLVTSLDDGMNLVAKEYVASRDDGGGALILSRFTGASHELADALIVNPYAADEIAGAIHEALEMAPEERQARMRRMRATVRENNIYHWAGDLIGELTRIRISAPAPERTPAPASIEDGEGSPECSTYSTVGQ